MGTQATARRRDQRLLLGTWAILALLAIGAWQLGAFTHPELSVVDARFSVRGDQKPNPDIALVLIDDKSFAAVGEYPFPRSVHARVLNRLRAHGAKVVAYDIIFAEPSDDPDEDDALLRAIDRSGNVVLAAAETDDEGNPNVLGGAAPDVRATVGSTNFDVDPQGVIRRVNATLDGLQTFSLATARRAGHRVTTKLSSHGRPIDYAGPEGTYPAYSFADVLADKVPDRALRGRIVVVGASSPTLQDVHPTSTSPQMSGPEIQANAIATVLDDFPLRRSPAWIEAILLVLLAGVAPLAGLRRSPWIVLAASGAAAAATAVVTQIVFVTAGLELPLVGPLAALAAGVPLTLLLVYLSARHDHELAGERHGRELAQAQMRAVEAADDARRKVERDLHDGAQQRLMALALDLSGARDRLRAEHEADYDSELDDVLDRSSRNVIEAVADLRALSRGAYPAVLVEGGIDAGLEALVEQLPATVRIRGHVDRRLDPRLEAVAYFFVSESVANALKHAAADRIDIACKVDDDELTVSVVDDGRGGADPDGSGLVGLRERVEAHGGTMVVDSAPGAGTRMTASLPVV